jgi:hypothetical protein
MIVAATYIGSLCKRGHDGTQYAASGHCVACMRLRGKTWVDENRDQWNDYLRTWRDEHREQIRANARARNHANPARKAAWRLANPDRCRELTSSWYRRNKARRLEVARAWAKAHPEECRAMWRRYRARKANAGGDHCAEDIATIFKMQKGRCAECRSRLKRCDWEVDHIQPVSSRRIE